MKNYSYFIKRDKHYLDPEEVLLDKATEEKEGAPGKLEWPISSFFLKGFFLIGLICFSLIFFRVFYLQIAKGKYYENLSYSNKARYFIINAPRGIIYDRYGEPLVFNSPSFSLVMIPLDLPKDKEEKNKITEEAVNIFNLEKTEIEKLLKDKNIFYSIEPIPLKLNLEVEEIRRFEANIPDNKGFSVITDISRLYPYGEAMAHLLGYVGRISPEDKKHYSHYPLVTMIGKDGLESFYEKELQGKWGKRLIEMDARGNVKKDLGTIPEQKGRDIFTTIDKDLQIIFYNSLKKQMELSRSKGGAGIAVNPKTGEILSMISLPSFDPNVFTKGSPKNIINQYLTSGFYPLFNRAISGLYQPGSLIKPLMALAALEEKTIDHSKKIFGEGRIVIENPYNPEVKYIFEDWKPHGWVDMKKAIAMSCNVYFWAIGGGYENIRGLGLEKIKKYWNAFGFDKKHNIDLRGESLSVLPDKEWLKKTRAGDPYWRLGDTYNISIGEGGLSLTPLAMVDYISIIANNGILMQPRLVEKTPVGLLDINVSTDNLKIVQEGMRQTITKGTARSLSYLPMSVAGKSGTPKFIYLNEEKYHGIFGAYGPFDDPQIAIIVLLEQPSQGSLSTLPVVEEVFRWYWENRMNNKETKETKNNLYD